VDALANSSPAVTTRAARGLPGPAPRRARKRPGN